MILKKSEISWELVSRTRYNNFEKSLVHDSQNDIQKEESKSMGNSEEKRRSVDDGEEKHSWSANS